MLKSFLITGIALFVLTWVLPAVTIRNWTALIAATIVLTLLQKIVRPILKLLFLPINLITLGLFSWVVNVIIFWIAVAAVPGFHIGQLTILDWQLGTTMSLVAVSFILGWIQAGVDLVV